MISAAHIEFHNNEFDGIKTVFISNRDIRCDYVPRKKTKEYRFTKNSVYLLIGNEEKTNNELIYVGETKQMGIRIDQHDRAKKFWDYAYVFYSSTDDLTKVDIKFLERLIYDNIIKAGRYKPDQSQPSNPHVTTMRKGELNEIFHTIKTILGGVFNVFPFKIEHEIFYLSGKDSKASGYLLGEGKKFVILKGSITTDNMAKNFEKDGSQNKLDELIKNNSMRKDKKSGKYEFLDNVICDSPSQASNLIYLGSTNGWEEWKNKDGYKLKGFREEE